MHHDDAVGQRHRFFLVVRHVAVLVMPRRCCRARNSSPICSAQLCVEIGQRLVEQQHFRLEDKRAGDRDALLLAAGERWRRARRHRRPSRPDRSAALDLLASISASDLRRMRSG